MYDYNEFYRRMYAPSPEDVSQPYEPLVPVISSQTDLNTNGDSYCYTSTARAIKASNKCLTFGQFGGMVALYVFVSFIHVALMQTHVVSFSMSPLSDKFYEIIFVLTSIFGLLHIAVLLFAWGIINPIASKRYWLIFCRIALLRCMIHFFELNIPCL